MFPNGSALLLYTSEKMPIAPQIKSSTSNILLFSKSTSSVPSKTVLNLNTSNNANKADNTQGKSFYKKLGF